jgi:hypothetical protein
LFKFSSNVISITYVIVKSLQDELSSCCITFAYEYSMWFTFMMLINNWMLLFGYFFIVNMFESYIVSVDVCILTKIQWLLFMKICWRQLVKYLCIILMIVYVCCWYPNNCNFFTYNICIANVKCWSFNHPFGLRRILSSFFS